MIHRQSEKGVAENWRDRRVCIGIRTGCICFPYAIGPGLPWEVASGAGLFEQPGHVLGEGLHGFEAFFVLLDLAFGSANAEIPVA